MATIDLALLPGDGNHPSIVSKRGSWHYQEYLLNLATAATTKGSALAAADVIQVIDIPPASIVMAGGIEVITAVGGGGSVMTLDLGVTGIDPDVFVDGYDVFAGVAGDFAAQPAAYQPIVIGNTIDTLDVLIATQTGTISSGVLRVFVYYTDAQDKRTATVAQPKS